MSELPLHEQVGFDYIAAIRELLTKMTWMDVAEEIGYENNGSLYRVLRGSIPSHVRGEALWALYVRTFGRKPPLVVCKSKCDPVAPSVKAFPNGT